MTTVDIEGVPSWGGVSFPDGLPAYTGSVQPSLNEHALGLYPYLPSPTLVEAVNLARALQRPLLLKGEPGGGKTRLARAIAYELRVPYYAWFVKSTSRARDGLYNFDAVRRLRDAQLAAAGVIDARKLVDAEHIKDYITWGPLGQALRMNTPAVVLIDEIDKADIDFPNDLLIELDERQFLVQETGEEVRATAAPIIIITSNDEKDLPDAFLRRCLFHYIEFPKREELIAIIQRRFEDAESSRVEETVNVFLSLREQLIRERGEGAKKVSTSELIDWFTVLRRYPNQALLARHQGRLPFLSVLLKSWDDHRLMLAYETSERP